MTPNCYLTFYLKKKNIYYRNLFLKPVVMLIPPIPIYSLYSGEQKSNLMTMDKT